MAIFYNYIKGCGANAKIGTDSLPQSGSKKDTIDS
jgi:hypothetical protein